jgi:hypothetical protein
MWKTTDIYDFFLCYKFTFLNIDILARDSKPGELAQIIYSLFLTNGDQETVGNPEPKNILLNNIHRYLKHN